MHRPILVLLSLIVFGAMAPRSAHASQRVLYLGDSMSMGAFGRELDKEIRGMGFELYTFVAGGATPYYWLSRYQPISSSIGYWQKTPQGDVRKRYIKAVPKVERLLEQHNPDVVVVQTGTNLYATLRSKRRTKEQNIKELERLLDDMAKAVTKNGRRVYWITPPDAHPSRYPVSLQEEMNSIMKRVVGKYGIVFESRKVTKFTDPYPKTDGIHYGPTEAATWAKVVANDFNTKFSDAPLIAANGNNPDLEKAEAALRAAELMAANPPKVASVVEDVLGKTGEEMKTAQSSKAEDIPKAEPIAMVENKVETSSEEIPTELITKAEEISDEDADLMAKESKITPPAEWAQLEVELRLVRKSTVEHMNNVTYHHCFVLYEYEVIRAKGNYPYKYIRIAETAVMNRRRMPALKYDVGKIRSMKVDPLSFYPNLAQWQMNDDLSLRPELPIYIASMRD